jgi:hypothetical protein
MHFRREIKAQILLISWIVLIGFCEEVFALIRGVHPRIRLPKPPFLLPIHPVVPPSQFFNNWSVIDVD